MKAKLETAVLYGIVDMGYVRQSEVEVVSESLIRGGVDLIQLRAKGCDADEIKTMAKRLVPVCNKAGVPLIINDFPEIAAQVGADGVHIGQDDGDLMDVRRVVGESMLVGRSTHSAEQARQALSEGFDYIGFGPLFPTPTKKGRPGIGLENVSLVQNDVGREIPVFFIGGITRKNIDVVKQAGAKRIVIVSDLLKSVSVESATVSAREIITNLGI